MKNWGVKVPGPAGKGIFWFHAKHNAVEFAVRWHEMAPKGTAPALVFPKQNFSVVTKLAT